MGVNFHRYNAPALYIVTLERRVLRSTLERWNDKQRALWV